MKFSFFSMLALIAAITLSAFTADSSKGKQTQYFWYNVDVTETETVGSALNGGVPTEKTNVLGGDCTDFTSHICYAGFSNTVSPGTTIPSDANRLVKKRHNFHFIRG